MMQSVIFCLAAGFVLSVSSAFIVKMEELSPSRPAQNSAWLSRLEKSERTNLTRPSMVRAGKIPSQCDRYACPPSQLIADRGSYAKVYFSEAPYAKSRVDGLSFTEASKELYRRLREYIGGENVDNKVMPMTAPVIIRIDANSPGEMLSPKNFTMFFFIDPTVKNPPAPKRKDIEVLMVNDYTLYIRTFSSYPVTYADWMREQMQLARDVEYDEGPFTTNFYYFATYDEPSKTEKRMNEVQLLLPHTYNAGP